MKSAEAGRVEPQYLMFRRGLAMLRYATYSVGLCFLGLLITVPLVFLGYGAADWFEFVFTFLPIIGACCWMAASAYFLVAGDPILRWLSLLALASGCGFLAALFVPEIRFMVGRDRLVLFQMCAVMSNVLATLVALVRVSALLKLSKLVKRSKQTLGAMVVVSAFPIGLLLLDTGPELLGLISGIAFLVGFVSLFNQVRQMAEAVDKGPSSTELETDSLVF